MRDARGRFLPDFIGIGPGRTGTTWLHHVLASRVDLPRGTKETGFFGAHAAKGLDWYARHFRHATGERQIAEICPYFNRPRAYQRIKQLLPDCKLICTIRNPVEHAYSVYRLMRHYVWTRTSFEDTIANRPHIDDANQYVKNLRLWFESFGRATVLVTNYDELRQAPQTYLDRITDFVGVQRISLATEASLGNHANSFVLAPRNRHLAQNARHVLFWLRWHGAYRTVNLFDRIGVWRYCFGRGERFMPLSGEVEEDLIQRWMPEIEALEELLGWDLSNWKRPRLSVPPVPEFREPEPPSARLAFS